MTSQNQVIALFDGQTADGTGSDFLLEPEINNQNRIYAIVLDDDLGGGVLTLEVSFDGGTTFVDWLLDGSIFQQTITGYDKNINITIPLLVRAKLAGATSPDLNVNLFSKFTVRDR